MRALLTLLFVLAAVPPAAAQADDVVPHAIVVGSNAGGPGQDDLRYAERDARRVAAVLRELGGYPAGNVRTVLAPTPARLDAALDEVAAAVQADQAAGRRSLVFFYYSGHARASGLVLGEHEVALADLRAKITALPATVTIVVLDACQSGAFTRVKGAEPAADFSFNARAGLDATGFAVMASSSESELSQESDFLEGSYFTHHLLVGLRGGGDRDRDGQVSLDEAYRYAYHQTLLATSHTAVGRQHVRFEVDLEGHGDVPLTYPVAADARIALPAALAGDVLVQRVAADAVIAEVHKAAGAAATVEVPAGEYRVLVRTAAVIHRCPVTVGPGGTASIDLAACDDVPLVDATAKAGAAPLRNPWSIAVAASLGGHGGDAFTRRLEDSFGYDRGFAVRGALTVDVTRRLAPHLAATARLSRITSETFSRSTELEPIEYSVTSHALTVAGRGELASRSDRAILWAEAGAGLTWARDRLEDEEDMTLVESHLGPHLTAGAGLDLYTQRWPRLGFALAARWIYAPTVDNLAGDTMDVGGVFVGAGVLYRP